MSVFRYVPSSLEEDLDAFKIARIYICAHEAQDIDGSATGGKPTTNHWVLFCAGLSGKSICIDPSPSGVNFLMEPVITENYFEYTPHAVKTTPLDTDGLTVKKLIDLIEMNKYDKYQFSSSGQGCRYWVSRVIKILESPGNLVQSDLEDAVAALEKVWAQGGVLAPALEQSPIIKGRFYALEDEMDRGKLTSSKSSRSEAYTFHNV